MWIKVSRGISLGVLKNFRALSFFFSFAYSRELRQARGEHGERGAFKGRKGHIIQKIYALSEGYLCFSVELYDQTKWNFKSARKNNETIKLKRISRVREILTKQSKQRESLECARYYQDNGNKENPQSACDTIENNRTKGHPKSARGTNKKQSNWGESL